MGGPFKPPPLIGLQGFALSIESAPERGKVSILWFNDYAGLSIRTPNYSLVVDPVDVDAGAFTQVDALLITHEHYDHLDTSLVSEIQGKTGCLVAADPTSHRMLSGVIPSDKLVRVEPGMDFEVGDVRVHVERSHHPPASTPVVYLITTEDGVCVFHTSDSLPYEGMRQIGERFKPDITFCTVGIAPGTSPKTGVEIAKLVRPKVAIPYHTMGTSALRSFADLLAREAPEIRCLVIERNKVYTLP
mgnify:CR=1 FL=1